MARSLGPRVLAALPAAAALATAGCWPQPGGTAGHQNWNPIEDGLTIGNVATLAPDWTAPGDLDVVWGRHVVGVVSGGNGTPGGGFVRVQSLDADTGAQIWSSSIAPSFIATGTTTGSAVVVDDDVWANWLGFAIGPGGTRSCGGGGVRLDLETGSHQGDTSLHTSVVPFAPLAAVHETSFGSSCTFGPDSALRVLDGATAAPAWQSSVGGGGFPVITVVDGNQLLETQGTTLRSFTASGCGAPQCAPVWMADVGAVLGLMIDGERLYATAGSGASTELLGLDRTDGTIVWQAPLPGPAPLAAFSGTVYAASGTTLAAYDGAHCAVTCSPSWTADLPAPAATNLAGAGGVVYTATQDGTLSAFDAAGCGTAACAPVKQLALDGTPDGPLIVASGHVFVNVSTLSTPRRIQALAPT